jgi:probable HAF family extracellular repeat protein
MEQKMPRSPRYLCGFLAIISTSFACSPSAFAAVQYTVRSLGAPAANTYSVAARDINNNGQIVGTFSYPAGSYGAPHAYLYSNGTFQDLGTMGYESSSAAALNNLGQVVGTTTTFTPPDIHGIGPAFYYDGTMHNLTNMIGTTSPYDINDQGQIAYMYGFYDGHNTIPLSLGGTFTHANSINNLGQVAGDAISSDDGKYHTFLYSGGSMQDLGTMGGQASGAASINDHSQIVGWINHGDTIRGFLYSGGNMQELTTLGGWMSSAVDINNNGQIIGATTNVNNTELPFVYKNGVMSDLNTLIAPSSGWRLDTVTAINDAGWIVGNGYDSNPGGGWRAFVLIPVPEPASFWLLVAGIGVGLAFRWRKRR